MINKENFKEKLAEVNIILTDQMLEQFDLYFRLIDKYNKVMDLTAISSEDEIYDRHFYNSLTIAFNENFNGLHLCDVGAGAGFPSIPLKIAFPDMKLTIIDPLNKRMEFLKIVIKELNLKDVNILVSRAEDACKTHKEAFDIVTARAVARLNILVEVISQLVKVNGMFISMKGQKGQEELLEAKNALDVCNFALIKETHYEPSVNYYFKKVKETPLKYPRNYGQIKKKPL